MDAAAQLAADPRWQRLMDKDFTCPCCGEPSSGITDVGFLRADPYLEEPSWRRVLGKVRLQRVRSTSDFCRVDDRVFIRFILKFQIFGAENDFALGPWVEVSEDVFQSYYLAEEDEVPPDAPGVLANELPDMPGTSGTPVTVQFQPDGMRPLLAIADRDCGLYAMQRDGLLFDRLLDIYDVAGNDLRQHLTAE